VDKIVEDEQRHIFLTYGVHVHYHIKHSIDLTPGASLPNDPVYRHYVMENEEIKCQIQELILKDVTVAAGGINLHV
jgi:hypothetical protein